MKPKDSMVFRALFVCSSSRLPRMPRRTESLCFSITQPCRTERHRAMAEPREGSIAWIMSLNSILSVRAHQAMSHNTEEYKMFLARVLEVLDKQTTPIVFLLWGGPARKLKGYLHNPSHLILECIHPSPLAANHGGWFGNNHFKEANRYLSEHGLSEINWVAYTHNL